MGSKGFHQQLRSLIGDKKAVAALDLVRKNKKNLSIKSPDGWTVIQTLIDATENEDDEIDNIISHAIDFMDEKSLNEPGNLGQTALYTAAIRTRQNTIKKLLSRHADATIKEKKEQKTPLHGACLVGDLDIVKILVAHDEKLTRIQDRQGLTPLDIACWKGHTDVVKFLLAEDPEVLHMTDNNGMSPLYTATDHGRIEVVEILVKKADIFEKTKDDGTTALDRACELGHKEIAVLLVDNGAQIECRDELGCTPLYTACAYGHLDIVNFLLEKGARSNVLTNENKTCLGQASLNGEPLVVRRLLELDAIRDLIDQPDKAGATPLVMACRFGHTEVVSLLLEAGADPMRVGDDNGSSPLMEASKWRYFPIVKLLLENRDAGPKHDQMKILKQVNTEDQGFSALQYACYHGHLKMVKLLLQYGADINEVDELGRTTLHNACRQGYKDIVEFLSTKVEDINRPDNIGWTALHYASWNRVDEDNLAKVDQLGTESFLESEELIPVAGKHAEILQCLLKAGAQMALTTQSKSTAFHLASEQGHQSRIGVLLGHLQQTEEILRLTDVGDKTALCLAMEEKNGHIVRQLLDNMAVADFGRIENKESLMTWLAKRPETHELARLLLSKDHNETDRLPSHAHTWSALEWAAYRGYPGLVWWFLFTSDPGPDRDQRIKTAERIANSFVIRGREKGRAANTKRVEPDSKDNRQDWLDNAEGKPDSKDTDEENSHVQILMILRNPPMTQTVGRGQRLTQSSDKPIYLPHSLDLINHYTANVVDYYRFKDRSGFLRRSATIKDVIYGQGPAQIMDEARETTHKLDSRYGPRDGTATYAWNEEDVSVRWIHLPANNMKWMSDLALAVSANSDINGSGLVWLDRSWDQVVGKSLSSRFMKPKCVYRTQENYDDEEEDIDEDEQPDEIIDEVDEIVEDDDEENGDAGDAVVEDNDGPTQAAIYMPYLTVAKHSRDSDDFAPEYEDLLQDYSDDVIQGSRTLDEFFYHSCADDNLRNDIVRRNGDQVLSKNIHGAVSKLDSWALLNVDQVWIWVIDNKTIITSTTHRRDDVQDPLLKAVLEKMNHSNEGSSGNRGPENTFEMSRLIVDTCVGFFDQEVQMSIETKKRFPTTSWRGSVQDVFTSALVQAAMREASLYEQFASDESSNRPEKMQSLGSSQKRTEVLEAANLFREIKDIRDELKMLRTIAEYQMGVQKDAPDMSSSSALSSETIVNDLKEMDKSASRIENAVNTTLSLEQNEISIAQAQEAANQGRTLMLFTVVTILFLPMSFFTSLFALDVASFQQTPTWAFLVLFCVSLAIFIPLAMYAIFSDTVEAYYYGILAIFNRAKNPKTSQRDTMKWKPVTRRGTFRSTEGTTRGFSNASIDAAGENAHEKLTRRRRVKTFYDEESLSKA